MLNSLNERMNWVSDPYGSLKTVAKFDVYGTDDADQWGGTRTTLWRTPDNCSGCEAWQAFGFYIPAGFQYPDDWFLLYQDFSSGGNPAQALELRNGSGCAGTTPRTYLCWKDQTAPDSGLHYFPLGPAAEGHWAYIVEHIKFLNTIAGFDQVWYSVDALPDTSRPPLVDWHGITAYTTDPNRSNIFMYRAAGSSSQHQTVYYCGFHRAANAVLAKTLVNCP